VKLKKKIKSHDQEDLVSVRFEKGNEEKQKMNIENDQTPELWLCVDFIAIKRVRERER
jgi:hypothetical protein